MANTENDRDAVARASQRGCARARPADRRSASSPVGPSGQPLHARRDFARHQFGASRARDGVRRMHVDVSRGRPGADASGRRDRVRQRHRGAKRERAIRRDSRRGGNRGLRGFDAGRSGRAGARGAYRGGARALSRNPARGRLRRESRGQEFAHQPARGFVRVGAFSRRLRQVERVGSQLRGVAVPSADAGGDCARESVPGNDDRAQSLRRTAGNRSLRRPARGDIRRMEEEHRGARAMPQRRGQARRNQHAGERLRVASEAVAADLGRAGVGDARLLSAHDRSVRSATMHVREQLPGGPGFVLVRRAVERVQEDRGGFHERRKSAAIPSHRCGGLSAEAAQLPDRQPKTLVRSD